MSTKVITPEGGGGRRRTAALRSPGCAPRVGYASTRPQGVAPGAPLPLGGRIGGPNSLRTGKITGNFPTFTPFGDFRRQFTEQFQHVAHEFPGHRNREFPRQNREFPSPEQGIQPRQTRTDRLLVIDICLLTSSYRDCCDPFKPRPQ